MRQPLALRRQSMLFLRGHLAKGAVEPVGPKKRIVAKTFVAARRPYRNSIHLALKLLNMVVGPRETHGGHEMRAPLVRPLGASLDQQRLDAIHCRAKILVGPGPSR